MGKRWKPEDFPKTNWNLKSYFWAPLFRCFGFFRLSLFRYAWVLSGVGVAGGSLVYTNVLLEPDAKVWQDPAWKDLEDWKSVMPSFYQRARTMLGAEENHHLGPADRILKESAESEKLGDSFKKPQSECILGIPVKPFPILILEEWGRTATIVNSVAVAWWAVVMGQKILSISITFISPKNRESG